MFTRGALVPFTRRSTRRSPAASGVQDVGDVLRRLHEAEQEVARTRRSLEEISAMLRGEVRPAAPAPEPPPQHPGLRRSVPPR